MADNASCAARRKMPAPDISLMAIGRCSDLLEATFQNGQRHRLSRSFDRKKYTRPQRRLKIVIIYHNLILLQDFPSWEINKNMLFLLKTHYCDMRAIFPQYPIRTGETILFYFLICHTANYCSSGLLLSRNFVISLEIMPFMRKKANVMTTLYFTRYNSLLPINTTQGVHILNKKFWNEKTNAT